MEDAITDIESRIITPFLLLRIQLNYRYGVGRMNSRVGKIKVGGLRPAAFLIFKHLYQSVSPGKRASQNQ